MKHKYLHKIINWSELSRIVTGGDRSGIRPGKIPLTRKGQIRKIFKIDFPEYIDVLLK